MAEVYKARLPGAHGLDKIVAIKRILPYHCEDSAFINMFLDEAKITLALNHPNIGQVYELNEGDGAYFICMEYVDGPNVSTVVKHLHKSSRRMPLDMAIYIMSKVASALFSAHTQADGSYQLMNIIHRDVSPHNVLVSRRGDVKLIDFGIAKARDRLVQTMAGTVRGKLLYMSPEHAASQPLDPRSDIFSAGMMLLALLNGRHIWKGLDEVEVLVGIRRWKVPSIAELRPDLASDVAELLQLIVGRAMAYEPADRYGDAEAFRIDLTQLLNRINPVFSTVALSTFIQEIAAGREDIGDSLDSPSTDSRSAQRSTPSGPSEPGRLIVPSDSAAERLPSGSISRLRRPPTAKVRTGLKSHGSVLVDEQTQSTPTPFSVTPGVLVHSEKTTLDTGSMKIAAIIDARAVSPPVVEGPSTGLRGLAIAFALAAGLAMVLLAVGAVVIYLVTDSQGSGGESTSSGVIELGDPATDDGTVEVGGSPKVEPEVASSPDAGVASAPKLDGEEGADNAGEETSTLRIVANTKGATVSIDGEKLASVTSGIGEDPLEVAGLTRGQKYLVKVSKPGYEPAEKRVEATAREVVAEFDLKRKPVAVEAQDTAPKPPGELRVSTVPHWAKVFANGRPICGQTPCSVKLKPGRYNIKLTNPNVASPFSQTVEIRSGQLTSISERF
jgi:serine/threonine protein kinase